jgi:predicted MFS family arabinose efflux permease
MAHKPLVPADVDGGGRFSYGWRIVTALAITQTVGFGVLYYAFAVFLTPMRRDLAASTAQITGALTLALLVSAIAAVPIGRWLDRYGGRALMTGGSVAATLLVVAWSGVRTIAELYLVFAGIGLASAMVLYESAFAVVVTWFRRRRAAALLVVSVVAGFASTIFLPFAGWLIQTYDWRTALLILAALHGGITIPLHMVIRRPPGRADADPEAAAGGADADRAAADRANVTRAALRDPTFWTLVVAFVAHTGAVAVVAVHIVAYLLELGHPAALAATISGLIGVLSVTGRLAATAAQRHRPTTTVVAAVFVLQALAALTFPLVGHAAVGAIACILAFGFGFGVATIARPTLLADIYGTTAYGTLSGLLAAPLTLAKALAPLAAAGLRGAFGSYLPVLVGVALACALAAAGLLMTGHLRRSAIG